VGTSWISTSTIVFSPYLSDGPQPLSDASVPSDYQNKNRCRILIRIVLAA
jgi:hypothetical protein